MSRRSHAPSEVYADEREHYSSRHDPPRRAPVAEYDEIDIRERRRTAAPEHDFLRDDYGRRSEVGQLVVRERSRSRERPAPSSIGRRGEVDIREEVVIRDRSRERPRRREVVDEEVIVTKSGRDRDRPRETEREYDEVVYYPESDLRPQQVRSEREEYVYRERERERDRGRDRGEAFLPPQPTREYRAQDVRYEREDFEYRPKIREPSPETVREEIIIKEKEKDRPRYREERDEEIIIRDREVERPRYREERDEEIIIRESERERPRRREERNEEIVIRKDERSRERPRERDRDYNEEEIIIREREREAPRRRARSYERESLAVSISERDRPRAKSRGDFRENELIIRRNEGPSHAASRGSSSRGGDFKDNELIVRRNERERELPRRRERSIEREEDDIIFRHSDNGRGRHNDEIIIRRNEPSPSPPSPPPAPIAPREPEPVRAPPIHQEVITHHRHIEHGYERAPEPPRPRTPPRARTPSPVRDERIEIRHRGISRNGRQYDDDIIFERETGSRRRLEGVHHGRGARDYESSGSDHRESRELALYDNRDNGRRFTKQEDKRERLWTEITRNLVSVEAIKEMGYEFEESDECYYVMEYLKYEDVQALVDLTVEIRDHRQSRIRQLEEERRFGREDRPRRAIGGPWDEERIVEREIIYGGGGSRRYR